MKDVLKRMTLDELSEVRNDVFVKRMNAKSKTIYDYFADLTDQLDDEIGRRMGVLQTWSED